MQVREYHDVDARRFREEVVAASEPAILRGAALHWPAVQAAATPRDREVNRIQGYLAPKDFVRMFAYVAERAYERGSLRDFLRRQS